MPSGQRQWTRPAGVRLISGPTLYLKFIAPPLAAALGIACSIGLGFLSSKMGAQGLAVGISSLFSLIPWFYSYARYHFPLKEVWLGTDGLIVSNFRDQIDLPFDAIASVTQLTRGTHRHIIVNLREETIFGRRFTFLPLQPKACSPFSSVEDDIAIELRARIDAAVNPKSREPIGRHGRSVMADDELDGPF